MWELDHEESWVPKNWCFWTVVLEENLESPLGCKEMKPINPKGNQSEIFIGRTDAKTKAPILWPSDAKSWLLGKDPDAGKDWRQEKGAIEDKMVGWHHRLYGCEFEQALGVGDGQGSLVCCSPWRHKESDMIEWLNWAKQEERKDLCHQYVKVLAKCSDLPWLGHGTKVWTHNRNWECRVFWFSHIQYKWPEIV